jgi:hypothetical protein
MLISGVLDVGRGPQSERVDAYDQAQLSPTRKPHKERGNAGEGNIRTRINEYCTEVEVGRVPMIKDRRMTEFS